MKDVNGPLASNMTEDDLLATSPLPSAPPPSYSQAMGQWADVEQNRNVYVGQTGNVQVGQTGKVQVGQPGNVQVGQTGNVHLGPHGHLQIGQPGQALHLGNVGGAEVHEMASPQGYSHITVEVFPTLGADPAYIRCPHCREQIVTKTSTSSRCCAHVCCCAMLLTCICVPFCWVPYCMKSCERTTHRCPKCKKLLGTHRG